MNSSAMLLAAYLVSLCAGAASLESRESLEPLLADSGERGLLSDSLEKLAQTVGQLNQTAHSAIADANAAIQTVKNHAFNITNRIVNKVATDVTSTLTTTGSQLIDFVDCVGFADMLVNITATLTKAGDECATKALSGVTKAIDDLLLIVSDAERLLEKSRNATYLCSDLDFLCIGLNLLPLPPQALGLAIRTSQVIAALRNMDLNTIISETTTCISIRTATYAAESTLALLQHVFNCIANPVAHNSRRAVHAEHAEWSQHALHEPRAPGKQ